MTWTKRAIELGYIQIIPASPLRRPPMQITLSPVVGNAIRPRGGKGDRANSRQIETDLYEQTRKASGFRPRRVFDETQIADVIRQLQQGRSSGSIAMEIGVSRPRIEAWRKEYELRMLRSENAELKRKIAQSSVIEKTDSPYQNYHA
jgi:Transposase